MSDKQEELSHQYFKDAKELILKILLLFQEYEASHPDEILCDTSFTFIMDALLNFLVRRKYVNDKEMCMKYFDYIIEGIKFCLFNNFEPLETEVIQ